MNQARTAACVIIGDEILTGKVHDENSHTLSKMLFERGVELTRIETIPDGIETIAETVRRYSESVDYVFTSGGIGPTHDDLTYEGVGAAFDLPVEVHKESEAKMVAFYEKNPEKGGPMNAARRRMCTYPQNSELLEIEGLWVPVVVVQNVYILPGVPWLFSKMIDAIADRFEGIKRFRATLTTQVREGDLAGPLALIQATHPSVAIGSYPQAPDADFRVRLTLESNDQLLLEACLKDVQGAINSDIESLP